VNSICYFPFIPETVQASYSWQYLSEVSSETHTHIGLASIDTANMLVPAIRSRILQGLTQSHFMQIWNSGIQKKILIHSQFMWKVLNNANPKNYEKITGGDYVS
jgi:hypothetical protein